MCVIEVAVRGAPVTEPPREHALRPPAESVRRSHEVRP